MGEQRDLTKTELEYLRVINELLASGKGSPSIGDVSRASKKSRTATSQAVHRLVSLGKIRLGKFWQGCGRSIDLPPKKAKAKTAT